MDDGKMLEQKSLHLCAGFRITNEKGPRLTTSKSRCSFKNQVMQESSLQKEPAGREMITHQTAATQPTLILCVRDKVNKACSTYIICYLWLSSILLQFQRKWPRFPQMMMKAVDVAKRSRPLFQNGKHIVSHEMSTHSLTSRPAFMEAN